MIRLAKYEEWAEIESWRNEHFLNMSKAGSRRRVVGQKGFHDAIWLVIDRRGKAVAALSYTQVDFPKQRFVHDMYAAPGHSVAGLILGEHFERFCDADGYELLGSTDPENVAYIQFLLKRGYEITGIDFRRIPRMVEEGSSSENLAPYSTESREVSSLRGL